MTVEQIIQYIILILPQIIQIVTVVALFLRRAAEMRSLNTKVADLTYIDHLKQKIESLLDDNKQCHKEIRELVKLNKELLTKIDRIERK